MSAGDLGIWMGVILAAVPGLSVYNDYGLLADIGAYFAMIYVIGIPAGIIIGLLTSWRT